ncbi:MAG: hypothetical protein IKA61_04925 [Clostridia bacterium]|nr:hypothetical protein [Clostridia bacterium]
MEKSSEEFAMEASHTAEADVNTGERAIKSNPYGKFKDAESLLKAYESLESEFTRRSQRLKAIEGELKSRSHEEKTVEKAEGSKATEEGDFIGRYPNSSRYANEIEGEVNGTSLSREQAYIKILERKLGEVENNPLKANGSDPSFNKEFSANVIKEYLKKVMKDKPKTKVFSGVSLSVPPLKPTTVAEASAMAKNYIKRQGE